MFFCYLHQSIHIDCSSKQVNGNNCFCLGCDCFFDAFHRDVHVVSIHIYQNRCQSQQGNHLNSCSKGEICSDHFISGLQIQAHHRYLKRIGSICTRNYVLDSKIGFQLFLKIVNFRPVDKGSRLNDIDDSSIDLGFDFFVLTFQVNHLKFLHAFFFGKVSQRYEFIKIKTGNNLGFQNAFDSLKTAISYKTKKTPTVYIPLVFFYETIEFKMYVVIIRLIVGNGTLVFPFADTGNFRIFKIQLQQTFFLPNKPLANFLPFVIMSNCGLLSGFVKQQPLAC